MKHVVKRDGTVEALSIEKIRKVVQSACEGYSCSPNELEMDAQIQFKPQMPTREIQGMLIKTAIEKVTVDSPDWQFVAAKLLLMDVYKECALTRGIEGHPYQNFHDFIVFATSIGIYSPKILQAYSEDQILELQNYIKPERDLLFNYAGLKTFSDRYMIKTHSKDYLELPQEAFMGVAMFIALAEEASARVEWSKKFYDVLSKFEVMTATPTLANARKVHHQLSSCFILTVDDSLDSIFDNVNTFAQLSKHGGGVGGDLSMVRAQGSEIRGYKNVAGGVIPWIRILNDSAIAVDQLGCVHKDSYVRVLKYVKTDKFIHNFFNRNEYGFSLDNEEVSQIIREHALRFSFSYSKWSKSDIEDFITMYVQGLPLDTIKNYFGMSRDQYKKVASRFKRINKGLPQGFVLLTGDLEGYAIHSSGEVIHKDSFKTLTQHKDRKGYLRCTLGKRSFTLHRLLATTFMDVPEGYTIDHVDGDKTNNSLDNLQVVSNEENISKGWEDSRLKRTEMSRIRRHLSYGHELNGARRGTDKIKIQSVVVESLPISKVCVGDTVESFNIETGKVEYKKVQATHSMVVEVEDQIKLSFSDGGFITTSNWHPFPVKRNNKIMYVRSDEVTLGDVTFNHKGIPTQVVDIDQEPNVSNSYKDLTIQDNNNYFCSSSSKEDNYHVIHNTRKGALSLTLNVYHSDIMDFLDLKTNNGDERRKAHDIFPAVGIPNNFMRAVRDKEDYYLFDPYVVRKIYNQEISDLYGQEFEDLYNKIVEDPRIDKKKFKARTIFKKILRSTYETGLPFIFFRDTVNEQNPNKHEGIVRCTNLCVTGDTRLATQFGLKKAEDLYKLDTPLKATYDLRTDSLFSKDYGVGTADCIEMKKTAEDVDVYEVVTKTGYKIKCTDWHEFYSIEDTEVVKKPLNELAVGDFLMIQSGEGQFGSFNDPELGFLTGLITADGTLSSDPRNGHQIAQIGLYNEKSLEPLKDSIKTTLKSVVDRYYPTLEGKTINKMTDYSTPLNIINHTENSQKSIINSTKLGRVLEERFNVTKDSKIKVPEFIWEGSRETVVAYLKSIFSTDACVAPIRGKIPSSSIQLTSISLSFLEDLQILLSNFGIRGRIQNLGYRRCGFSYVRKDGTKVNYDSKTSYRLDLNGNNGVKFFDEIGFFNFNQDKFQTTLDERAKFNRRESNKSESFKDEIVSISYVGKEDVYDTTQLHNHSLIFNGLVTGNCVEINQNMSPTQITQTELEDGKITIEKEAGDLVVCNLSSLNLYKVHEEEDLKRVIPVQVRMLDNVITLNFYPVREAEHTNQRYRAIGLGTMGYHAYLANKGIAWESEAHIEEADKLYEKIAYYTIKSSSDLAKEKGSYSLFEGSDWQSGHFFGGRDLGNRMDWEALKDKVNKDGLRNGYLLAVAPTGSISIITGTTASIDPIFAKVEKTEKKDGILISAVPGLNDFTRFMYKESHKIDMNWSVRANATRQRWIDQSQSFNLFISQDTTAKELFSYYFNAWEQGCKTVYYLRSKAVEVEECESCT